MRHHRLSATATLLLLVASACSDSSGPKIGPPARVEVSASPTAVGVVKNTIGTFSVKVSDAGGQGVSGAIVSFSANGGGGIALTPTSATSDASGIASTTVVLGTLAGPATLSASVSGVAAAATVTVTATAGAASKLVASPDNLRLNAVGDTARIASLLQDVYANTVTGASISYVVGDPTLVSVDGTGLVRALRVGGTTTVIASIPGQADTVTVAVLAPGSSPCSGVTSPVALAVGGMADVSGAAICLGGAVGTDYTVVAYNTSTDGSTPLTASILATGVAAPPSATRISISAGPLAARSPSGEMTNESLVRNESFHLGLLERTRTMSRLFGPARAARTARLAATSVTTPGRFAPKVSYTAIPANAVLGDL
ncbi:MAG: hypothetical protein ABIP93_08000, partial [Gemmatimonadaceae bacterium]